MQKDKLKNKIYTNLFIILLIFFIIYFIANPLYTGSGTFFSPQDNISKLLTDKKDLDGAITQATNFDAQLLKANNMYSGAKSDLPLDNLNRILPDTTNTIVIAYELTRMASTETSGVLLSGLKVSDNGGSKDKKFNTIVANFQLQGSYENIKAFLRNLEISERIYNVTSLNFNSDDSSQMGKYSITVETYYLKDLN